MAGIFDSFMSGYRAGDEIKRQREAERKQGLLAQYASQAYGGTGDARKQAIAQAVAIDPDAGFALDKNAQALDDRQRETVARHVAVMAKLPRAQQNAYYKQILPEVQQAFPGMPWEPELTDEYAAMLPQFAQALGGGGDGTPAELQTFNYLTQDLTPEQVKQAKLVKLGLDARQGAARLVNVPDGQGGFVQMEYDPYTGRFRQPDYSGEMADDPGNADVYPESQQDPSLAQSGDLFAGLSGIPGVQVTSGYRTPEHNAEVGGVANSYHTRPGPAGTGLARDILPPKSPEQAQQIRQYAAANGLEVINEGDHWHLEPRPQRRGHASQRKLGYTPPKAETKAPSELEKRIEMARAIGATDDDIRRMVIGREGAAAGAKPLPVGALNQLLEVEDALGATQNVSAIIQKHAKRMEDGTLNVYPEDAIGAKFRTAIGRTNDNDVNVNEFRADMTRIVNESLRLNKGVQTEGDAQRAAQELMSANDQKTAARALRKLAEYNRRAVQLQRQKAQVIRKNYGQDENGDPLGQRSAPAQAGGGWKIEVVQ